MLFSSMVFIWFFLPIVFIGNFLLQRAGGNRASNILLLLASLFFYAWGEPVYIILMLVSITVNWGAGLLLRAVRFQKTVLAADVLVNIGLLGYFKYSGMVVDTICHFTGAQIKKPEVALPIGISFFTFQALSYVIDVYRKEVEAQRNWFHLALYVSFFPQLIAGPIVKYKDVNEQIENRSITLRKTALGIRRFTYGFAKKILIANVMGQCADRLYAMEINSLSSSMAWIASIAYTLQIYYDFSGYSDMAIGLGSIFGFRFKENFKYPYTSHSIREFWRRWHISLSSWFRDYVYIPLGGNRKGTLRTYVNLFIVFLLTGIWHGASWTFVLWGIYHGLFCIIERLGLEKFLERHHLISWIYTILVVNFGWVFFRLDDLEKSLAIIARMLQPWRYSLSTYSLMELLSVKMILLIFAGIISAGIIRHIFKITGLKKKMQYSVIEIAYCSILFILCIMSLASSTYNPFIYFRF